MTDLSPLISLTLFFSKRCVFIFFSFKFLTSLPHILYDVRSLYIIYAHCRGLVVLPHDKRGFVTCTICEMLVQGVSCLGDERRSVRWYLHCDSRLQQPAGTGCSQRELRSPGGSCSCSCHSPGLRTAWVEVD